MDTISLGFVTNPRRENLARALCAAVRVAQDMGFTCVAEEAFREAAGTEILSDTHRPDMLFALGGDGTILRAAPLALRYDIPICGVNLGRIGFLSEMGTDRLRQALGAIQRRAYTIDSRLVLCCTLNERTTFVSANDVLLYKSSFSGVVGVQVWVDGADAGVVYGDGLIVSTPTGATGYSISAGGPVIAPGVDVALITPVCPHSLTFRPIVTSADADIHFSVADGAAHLAVDGTPVADVGAEDRIRIGRAPQRLKFVRLAPRNLYALIRDKLT